MAENSIAQGVENLGVRIKAKAHTLEKWKNLGDNFKPGLGEIVYITDAFEEAPTDIAKIGFVIGDGNNSIDNLQNYHINELQLINEKITDLESKDDFLKEVTYNRDSKELVFTWKSAGESPTESTKISVEDFARIYQGEGVIKVNDDSTISHKTLNENASITSDLSLSVLDDAFIKSITIKRDNYGHIKDISTKTISYDLIEAGNAKTLNKEVNNNE